MKKVLFQARL